MRSAGHILKPFVIISLLLPLPALGQEWEYKVVYLPSFMNAAANFLTSPSIKRGTITEEASGAHVDTRKTEILNKLAHDRWEVIAVTGQSGADHAVYLKRRRTVQ